jgi:hypothetical protein
MSPIHCCSAKGEQNCTVYFFIYPFLIFDALIVFRKSTLSECILKSYSYEILKTMVPLLLKGARAAAIKKYM